MIRLCYFEVCKQKCPADESSTSLYEKWLKFKNYMRKIFSTFCEKNQYKMLIFFEKTVRATCNFFKCFQYDAVVENVPDLFLIIWLYADVVISLEADLLVV